MPTIKIGERERAHAKHLKQNLEREELETLSAKLYPLIEATIERAFKEYCKGHTSNLTLRQQKEIEETEWTRFRAKLRRYLR